MRRYETRFLDFFQKNVIFIGFFAVSILGLLLRIKLFPLETADYSYFMKSWIDQLKEHPGISGIGENIGEYNVPYMFFLAVIARTPFSDLYEIKGFSVLFDFIGAFAVILLLSHFQQTKLFTMENLLAYAAILFTPVVFLNSAFWAQCDFIYVSMLLFCMYFMVKERYALSMIFFGIAFAFKLQAMFFLPVILIYYFAAKKMRALNFLWIPVVFIIAALPAIFAGRGIVDTFTIYTKQTSIYENLTMECPNIYVFLPGDYAIFSKVGIMLTILTLGIGACLLIHKGSMDSKEIVLLAVWSTMVCIYFLPAMHERYVFIACIFSIVWAFLYHKDWWIAVGINLVCFLSSVTYLFKVTIFDLKYLAVANLVFLIAITIRLFARLDTESVKVMAYADNSKGQN
ncbi:hypothetical protein [Ruminococcus sp.]|uniref:hypothetical protein n=1 Tax=Ruminococcus sp. TaxID=41978 RepID=UPI0025E590CA|nr:hypothetical protein [Ruminococcus sp.]